MLRIEDQANVRIRAHNVQHEARLVLFDPLPGCLLALRLACSIGHQAWYQRVFIVRIPSLLHLVFVPGGTSDGLNDVGRGFASGCAGGQKDEALDARFCGPCVEDTECLRDGTSHGDVGIRVKVHRV